MVRRSLSPKFASCNWTSPDFSDNLRHVGTDSPAREALKEEVEERMYLLGINQTTLAERAGVSVPTVRKVLRGYEGGFEGTTLLKIAVVLGFDPAEFRRRVLGEEPKGDLVASPTAAMTAALRLAGSGAKTSDERLELLEVRLEALDRKVDQILGRLPGAQSE